jgi:very-short-patch-repair endonuclease
LLNPAIALTITDFLMFAELPSVMIVVDTGKQQQIINQFLLKYGWLVVRFNHSEVIDSPDICCQAIAQVIHELIQ